MLRKQIISILKVCGVNECDIVADALQYYIQCEEKCTVAKACRKVAQDRNLTEKQVYDKVVWSVYQISKSKEETATLIMDGFKEGTLGPKQLFDSIYNLIKLPEICAQALQQVVEKIENIQKGKEFVGGVAQ